MYTDIMSYETHANVNGADDLLSKLYSFLNTRGWTIEYYGTDCAWVENPPTSGNYEVQSAQGTGDNYLGIRSNASIGYTNQDLRYQFYTYTHATEATNGVMEFRGIVPGQGAISTTTATPPWDQLSEWGASGNWHAFYYPSGTIPNVWFFGNDYFFAVEVQNTTTRGGNFAGGSPQLITEFQNTTQHALHLNCACDYDAYYGYYHQWDPARGNPHNAYGGYFNSSSEQVLYADNAARTAYYNVTLEYFHMNCNVNKSDDPYSDSWLNVMLPSYESFSGRRTLVKPMYWTYDPNIPGNCPGGSLPVFATVTTGLNFGDTLTYGSQQYLAFPAPYRGYKYGYSYRIA